MCIVLKNLHKVVEYLTTSLRLSSIKTLESITR